MTEDEAKTKLCCGPPAVAAMALYVDGDMTSRRSMGNATGGALLNCQGALCMAWRPLKRAQAPAVRTSVNPVEDTDWVVIGGFCGLVGKP